MKKTMEYFKGKRKDNEFDPILKQRWNPKFYDLLDKRRYQAYDGGGEIRKEKQHENGKWTVRERIEYFFDTDSFIEVNMYMESLSRNFGMKKKKTIGDGAVTGYGTVNGNLVFIAAQDFTVIGGTLGEFHAKKICHIMDMAYYMQAPIVFFNDSGGARIEEGIDSLAGYSGIFYRNSRYSGVIPQIAVIMGPCAGGACYSPAICDFIFMTKETSRMFITGPGVIKAVTGENVTQEELGGSYVHSTESGVAHFVCEDDEKTLDKVKELLSYLPRNHNATTKVRIPFNYRKKVPLECIVPDNPRKIYDVHDVITAIIDDNSFFEIQKDYAKNIVIGYAFLEGREVGIIANQPKYMAGSLDSAASEKAARFIRQCDCFHIPLITLVDVPGFFPGMEQEHTGIIRRGAKLLYAYSEATVPKITLIMRKAFGGAYIAMNSKGIGADCVFAWPIAQLAVMGAEGAVDIIFKKEIADSTNPVEMRREKIAEYEEKFMNPYIAAAKGYVDEVIKPEETRSRFISALKMTESKQDKLPEKKHGNIPL